MNDWGAHAVAIQRRHAPKDWPEQLDHVPEECREAVETYLRSIARRMRTVRLARGR